MALLEAEFATFKHFLESLKGLQQFHYMVFDKFCGQYFGGARHSEKTDRMVLSSEKYFLERIRKLLQKVPAAVNGWKVAVFLVASKEGFGFGGVNVSSKDEYFVANGGL